MQIGRIVSCVSFLAASALAEGRAPEQAPSAPITVIAPRPDAEKAAAAARTYADRVLPTPVYRQFARWLAPVCIKVAGINPVYAPRIAANIRAVAEAAKVPVAPDQCQPNLLVIVTPHARRTIDVITARRPGTLARLPEVERRAVRKAPLLVG